MKILSSSAVVLLLHLSVTISFAQESLIHLVPPKVDIQTDWHMWRGPYGNGHAYPDQQPPTEWNRERNIKWKTAVAGLGHGSPIVVGDNVFLATSQDELEVRQIQCFDRISGKELWNLPIHEGKATPPRNKKGSQASSTPVCDGEYLYINFLHNDAMYTSAITLDQQILWQQKVSSYVVHQGFGSSPLLYKNLVIASADNKSGGAIAGLDKKTGKIIWKRDRPKTPNYPSPVILKTSGTEQLLMTGCNLVTSLNPLTGEEKWEIDGATTECVTTTVTDGSLIYSSGGYPKNHIAAIKTDGSGEIAWENGIRMYVPSMIVKNRHLYGVTDAGVAMCWVAGTGEEIWKGRLGGTFSASLVLVNETLFATNEEGETFVFKASPEEFELISKNKLGDICFATPAIADSQIFYRAASKEEGKRVEYLYCISNK